MEMLIASRRLKTRGASWWGGLNPRLTTFSSNVYYISAVNASHHKMWPTGRQRRFRQRRKCRAFCLGVTGFVSPPIGQALADDPADGPGHALGIVHAEGDALVVSEVEFCEVAL